MRITYTPNPLRTVVELDDGDVKLLRLKLEIEELEERIYSAYIHLDGKYYKVDAAKALSRLNIGGLEKDILCRRITELVEHYISELKGVHVGDCTCVPCSCSKCHAEGLLGINTIEGLGKHPASKISGLFGEESSIEDVIRKLENYEPVNNHPSWAHVPQADFDRHIPRWKDEAARTLKWLSAYRDAHFAGVKVAP